MGAHVPLGVNRPKAGKKIGEKKETLSQASLHAVPKYIEKIHIPEEVSQSCMEEHGGKDILEMRMGWDKTMGIYHFFKRTLR